MTTMTAPRETKNLDGYGNPPLDWQRLIDALNAIRDLPVSDSASHYWIGTTRSDGRPHIMGVGIVWHDGRFYLVSGPRTQKSRNLARDPHCTVSVAAPGLDIVAEGEAKVIRDTGELERIATLFDDWGPQVRDGAFWHEFSAPSAGPPPWDVYEITPTTIYAVATAEPNGATRWRL
ncbi:MAG TPA: pyridoxamine 5'-phosphate oxidase family protein [Candidatus Limnocylindria bacterium]|nr:pyridoxamine 5'-phosphate oxidase family protein [Candidatus Limnocylindria bacterium]